MCKIIWWNIALPVRSYSCQIYILNAHFLYVSCNYGSWMIKNITTLVAYALVVNIRPSKRKQLEKSIVNGPNTWWIFTRQAATKAVQHNYADAGTSTLSLFLLDLIPSSAKMNTKKFWHDFRHRRQCWLWCPCNEVYGRRLETAKGTWKRVTALHKIASNPSIC